MQRSNVSTTYNFVLSGAGNNTALDSQTRRISSHITLHLGHLAVCGDKGNKR